MTIMPGVAWHSDVTVPAAGLPLDVAKVRDEHLRVVNGTVEDAYIEALIRAAMRVGERTAWRAFLEQTRVLTLDRLPADGIVYVPYPPILSIETVEVVAEDGTVTPIAAADYRTTLPAGPEAGLGRIQFAIPPAPAAGAGLEAIQITYRAGYVQATDPVVGTIPFDLQHAMLLWIGEVYKTRTLSVQGTSTIPALIQAHAIYLDYRPY